MPHSFSFGKIQFETALGKPSAAVRRDPDAPFLMVVLGDFGGRDQGGAIARTSEVRPVAVDCDNFDSMMRKHGVHLRLPALPRLAQSCELGFESIDDFRPERLLKDVPTLSALVQVRNRLGNPSCAATAVLEAERLLAGGGRTSGDAPGVPPKQESVEDTMARLLGGTVSSAQPAAVQPASGAIDLNALIKGIVAPSVVAGATPEQIAARTAVEAELGAGLRAILHHPDFQQLEAVWRGLELLVREHGGEENLRLHFLDWSKAGLIQDVGRRDNLEESALFGALRGQGWALLMGLHTFNDSLEEIGLIGRLAKIAAALGTSFVAGAGPHFIGCESLAGASDPAGWIRSMNAECREAWAAVRALPEARHLALTIPRVLLRQPYGKASDPVDGFPFEELPDGPPHESFLWGGGALVCGHLLAEAFRNDGWSMETGAAGEMDGLPVYAFHDRDGGTEVKPCAETWLSDRAGDRILESGLTPILSIKGRGAVRLAGMQSVALPAQRLFMRTG